MQQKKRSKETSDATFIKRKKPHGGEEGHHGGIWKIAYADFMTAMMTFFLVMWLINSASKEKITRLASYFNPVKMTDRTPAKGVRDNTAGGVNEEKTAPGKGEKSAETTKMPEGPHQQTEETLFHNPFGVLAQLASQAQDAMAAAMPKANASTVTSGGPTHDPFATDLVVSQPYIQAGQPVGPEIVEFDRPAAPKINPPVSEDKTADIQAPPGERKRQASKETQDAAAQLAKEIARTIESLPVNMRPNITAKATDEGVLISLTDDLNFSMFKIASAEPCPQLVLVLEKLGNLINKHVGKLVVRGHTDGRQYTGDAYGNWRLSINRANMAYLMLLRSKVENGRFLAVEGYADRSLKNKADPLAAENRRIEILIKGAES